MKIIAGSLRGRKFEAHSEKTVKPISGRIKQSLFDILFPVIQGTRFLDVFAGTGAVGFEALSRGSEFVFFLENNRRCVQSIEENIVRLNFSARAKVYWGDALKDLSWVPFRAGISFFDIIFLGPPYRDAENRSLTLTEGALKRVLEAGLLSPNGIIVSQHHIKEIISVPTELKVVKETKYGDTILSFMRWRREEKSH
jgi:16S rRNA (guanine(966)-N(2))-methyltransferase RsmD